MSLNLKIVVTYSTAVTGLLTIIVGVYFKEVLSSFFQGLMLSVHAPFVVGDVVRVRARELIGTVSLWILAGDQRS